jgi:Holliday junction resolvase RusA-like endonuclease
MPGIDRKSNLHTCYEGCDCLTEGRTARLVIPGQPITKKNSQVIRCINGKPVVLQSKAYRAYEKAALEVLRAYQGERFSGPVEVTVHYWLKDNRRPDLNNLMAATADILQRGGIVKDDKNIVSWDHSRIAMETSSNPRVEITIRPLESKLWDL